MEYRLSDDDLFSYHLSNVPASNAAAAVKWLQHKFPEAVILEVFEGLALSNFNSKKCLVTPPFSRGD